MYLYQIQVIGQRNKMFVLINSPWIFQVPRDILLWHPRTGEWFQVKGSVWTVTLFWNLSTISRVSHCRAGLRLRRDRHTGKHTKPCFSSHTPICVPPNFMSFVPPLILPHRSNFADHRSDFADKKQIIVTIVEEKYFVFFLSRRNECLIYLWAF